MQLSQAKTPLAPTSLAISSHGEYAVVPPLTPAGLPPTFVYSQTTPMPGMNPSNPPVTERCPNCGSTATPIYTKNRKKQWISCAILAVLSPCLCWVPFCINSCLDTDIQCTQCLKTRKIYNPIIRTEAIIQ